MENSPGWFKQAVEKLKPMGGQLAVEIILCAIFGTVVLSLSFKTLIEVIWLAYLGHYAKDDLVALALVAWIIFMFLSFIVIMFPWVWKECTKTRTPRAGRRASEE